MASLFNLKADLEAALPNITQPQPDVPTPKNRETKKPGHRRSQTTRERKKPKTYGGIQKAQVKKQDKQHRRYNQPSTRVMSKSTFIETLELALPEGFTHPDENTIANILTDTVVSNISSTLRLHGQARIDIPRIHAFAHALFAAIDYQTRVFGIIDYHGEDLQSKYFSEVAQTIRRDGVTGGALETFSMAPLSDEACDRLHQYFVAARQLYLQADGPADAGLSGSTTKTRFLIKLVDRYMSFTVYWRDSLIIWDEK
ncbi:hypothetical protein CGMCC3_g4880 [Colletotrichum fructicola]|uniref:Uncharacterized protein n=1 Tax=Colletotrichum fructicola (strain Nara gc5) TaxID=1213859 RepID=A0A7J6JFH8_COLFN|nr:uncharacterized protein CGMCC3_g4880 [Colletotrichum fructicola]KAE9579316.1 hypothetical protein CGMCC3_g4880 [Colletotrichum fructicola]KAF4432286.1 hypothetical protein CFRS1_v013101 [Colletotrichum fructicola]KAF4489077.1 hypothetical protein CGGC5_v003029 [Colletotrichum fructicola Nara gc5]